MERRAMRYPTHEGYERPRRRLLSSGDPCPFESAWCVTSGSAVCEDSTARSTAVASRAVVLLGSWLDIASAAGRSGACSVVAETEVSETRLATA
eukprot:2528540-Pleurochrysis_carterae.AAC.1